MVIPSQHSTGLNRLRFWPLGRSTKGYLAVDLLVAMGLLIIAVFPLAYSLDREQRLFRAYYYRAVAMEIVDGEMEVLAAGGWKVLPEGKHDFSVKAESARNLPPGHFFATREARLVRLEWVPAKKDKGGPVKREMRLP
jgi:hypothetical protein